MYTYAQILGGQVLLLMQDALPLNELYAQKFNPNDITLVDVTNVTPQPQPGWLYDGANFTDPTPVETLAQAQANKLNELDVAAATAYVAGFRSSASGTALWYDSDKDTQTVINRQYLIALGSPDVYNATVFFAGLPAGVTPVRAKATQAAADSTKTVQLLNASQMVQLGNDLAAAWANVKSTLWNLQNQVYACTSVAMVSTISWSQGS